MRDRNTLKNAARLRRKKHIRKVVSGTKKCPRLVVYRSLRNIYAQLVDDVEMVTLTGVSSLTPSLKEELSQVKTPIERGEIIGQTIAKMAKKRKVKRVVFDRNGFPYHGQVKAVAEGARKGGLEF
ncbi:50S ribosomal protein L18 [bacterium SM23_57]|nr:MAG: 50S ribosomal protein L18 [bacterium SM23_57]